MKMACEAGWSKDRIRQQTAMRRTERDKDCGLKDKTVTERINFYITISKLVPVKNVHGDLKTQSHCFLDVQQQVCCLFCTRIPI